VFPNLPMLLVATSGKRILDYDLLTEAGVIRLVKNKGYKPELLFWDDGSLISVMTGAALSPVHKKLIGGGVYSRAFMVCDISDDQTGAVSRR
jgi:arylesterase/paraoxonase